MRRAPMLRALMPWLAAGWAGSLLSCSTGATDVAGGTNIPNSVAGVVYTQDGDPAVDIGVTLLQGRGADSGAAHSPVDSTRTDDGGEYFFDSVAAGDYYIAAAVDDSSMTSIRAGVEVAGGGDEVFLWDTLRQSGALSGHSGVATSYEIRIRLLDTPYETTVRPDGTFGFAALPPGTYLACALVIGEADSLRVVPWFDTVVVYPDSEVVCDTVRTQSFSSVLGMATVDDFEDGNSGGYLGYPWWTFNNSLENGNSWVVPFGTAESLIVAPGADSTSYCLHFEYGLGDRAPYYAGAGIAFASYRGVHRSFDESLAQRLNFYIKGNGSGDVRLKSRTAASVEIRCLEFASLPAQWTYYSLDLDSVRQAGPVADSAWSQAWMFVDELLFVMTGTVAGTQGEVWIDQVELE